MASPFFPSLADQDGDPLVGNANTYSMCVPSAAELRRLSSIWPLDLSLPSCWHLDILAPETATPLLSHKHTILVVSAGAGFGHTVHLTSLFYPFIPLFSYICSPSSPLHPFLSPRFVPLLNIPQTLCNPKTPFPFISSRMYCAVPGRNLLWSERWL